MADDRPAQSRPELSAEALREWNTLVENVLRGIAHALNNRAAALSAVIELTQDSDDTGVIGSILTTELERVSDLVRAVRSLGAPKSGADAFMPSDAASEALAVLRLHAETPERGLTIDADGAAPLRVARWMFVRALIALGAQAIDRRAATKLVIAEDGEWLVARLDGEHAPSSTLSPYASELARAMGGEPLRDGYGFRVPTLLAVRRREGRGG